MVEVSRSTDLVPVGRRSEGEVVAGEHAGYLVATGTFGGHAPERPIEHTGAAVESLYETPFFAGVIAGLSSLHRSDPPAKFILPLHLEPEEVLGYRALPGTPITTVASAPENMMIWGQEAGTHSAFREYFGPSGRTVISLIELPAPSRLLPSGREALEDVARWTGLAHEALGALLGASRRSVYNWLRGGAMSSQFEARALRLRAALRPLAERRAPGEVANWLQAGVTPPAGLVQDERWEDFEALLREELLPRVAEPMAPEPEEGEPETYSAATRLAVLSALRTPPPVEQRRRPEWRPLEVTGTVPLADDEEE